MFVKYEIGVDTYTKYVKKATIVPYVNSFFIIKNVPNMYIIIIINCVIKLSNSSLALDIIENILSYFINLVFTLLNSFSFFSYKLNTFISLIPCIVS